MVKREFLVPFFIGLLVLVGDRITKLIIQSLEIGRSIIVIKDYLHFTYVVNPGAGFGIFKNASLALLIFSLIVFFFVVFYFFKTKDNNLRMSLAILASGIFGNVIDRILYGAVIDFIDFRVFPVFNISDMAICVGIISIAIITLLDDYRKKKHITITK